MSEELACWEVEWLLLWRSKVGSPKHCRQCQDLTDQIGAIPHSVDPSTDYAARLRAVATLYTDLLDQARKHMFAEHPNQMTEVVR